MNPQLEIIVDNFAGGGGASTGIEMAIGRSVDIAINHDSAAIAMHKVNHPDTLHYCESVWEVDPRKVTNGRPVALVWFSPDCKHFSKAKGGKPVEKHIRGLAWVAVRWAATVKPRVIMLENVEEFKTWGPLLVNGKPDPKQKGRTFKAFVHALERQGYQVEWRELRTCDYEAPTSRKRFFLIARCDGLPIVWPEPTHGDPNSPEVKSGKLKPWRTAAEIIDWSKPCPSIFERKKPLVKTTMRRIGRGIHKFVINNPEPFIVQIGQNGFSKDDRSYQLSQPLTTIVTKSEHCLITPFLTQYHGYDANARGQVIGKPILTIDTSNRYGLVAPFLSKFYKTGIGQSITEPLHTVTAFAGHFGEIRAFLTTYYGNNDDLGQAMNEPLRTVTTKDRFGIVSVSVAKMDNLRNLGHWPKVRTILNDYCGYSLADNEILLFCVNGIYYFISDIGLRMLIPRELFDGQSFPHDYVIDRDYYGKYYPKSAQVARCGNAVAPVIPNALVRVNLPELCGIKKPTKLRMQMSLF
ncbi:DNA cytosine methyltransferase [Desulfosporosinus sp. OT]|uniref:DNA cytosine methyltransferase n=1 Tax=Desulfosporosinus sp. OT TaxID=913865 RepID=UPI000223A4EA|nr:DNA cytosine methyltransferase [Desulfosporosinus sp. OT]EGW36491.1 C-5 cytosine-specific DNA methylase family protein [Desulfosporosinus sp. OT]